MILTPTKHNHVVSSNIVSSRSGLRVMVYLVVCYLLLYQATSNKFRNVYTYNNDQNRNINYNQIGRNNRVTKKFTYNGNHADDVFGNMFISDGIANSIYQKINKIDQLNKGSTTALSAMNMITTTQKQTDKNSKYLNPNKINNSLQRASLGNSGAVVGSLLNKDSTLRYFPILDAQKQVTTYKSISISPSLPISNASSATPKTLTNSAYSSSPQLPKSIQQTNMKSNLIQGDKNTVRGYGNIGKGDNNSIIGIGNNFTGDYNNVTGKNNFINGDQNQINKGQNNSIIGSQNKLTQKSSQNNLINSNQNTISGSNNKVYDGRNNIIMGNNNLIVNQQNQQIDQTLLKGAKNNNQLQLQSYANRIQKYAESEQKRNKQIAQSIGSARFNEGLLQIVKSLNNQPTSTAIKTTIQTTNRDNIINGQKNQIGGSRNNIVSADYNKINGSNNILVGTSKNIIQGSGNYVVDTSSSSSQNTQIKFSSPYSTLPPASLDFINKFSNLRRN